MTSVYSQHILFKILDLFKANNIVQYVAILDYNGKIQTHVILNNYSKYISAYANRCLNSISVIKGTKDTIEKFSDKTNVLSIYENTENELICFVDFIIYVYSLSTVNEQKISKTKNGIKALDKEMSFIFEPPKTFDEEPHIIEKQSNKKQRIPST